MAKRPVTARNASPTGLPGARLPGLGYFRVAAAVPRLRVADVDFNVARILELVDAADAQGVQLLVFPELSVTAYTAGDLFQQETLLDAANRALLVLAGASSSWRSIAVVGVPFPCGNAVFNVAAVIGGGRVRGLVPKTYIPAYKEFYEERWFASSRELSVPDVVVGGQRVPIGADLLFRAADGSVTFSVEVCEDLWAVLPPSSFHVLGGAEVVLNLSASPVIVGKADYRRSLVLQQSARGLCGYVYAGSGIDESTTDVVFDGQVMIAENGILLSESRRFSTVPVLVVSDLDLEHIRVDRQRTTTFGESIHASDQQLRIVELPVGGHVQPPLYRPVNPTPFVPREDAERDRRTREIFSIQATGLATRLMHARIDKLVLGLSGGLDSTLALLVGIEACRQLELPQANINALTMPGFGTSSRTRTNAERLARATGVTLETIDITRGCMVHFKDIGHDPDVQDVTFENVQARYRTMLLMDRANQVKGLVLGTGDLSELALGWNTFSGDQISHYNVNAGVPKTLVKHLVAWASEQDAFVGVRDILRDVLDTPISPELVGQSATSEVGQRTEELIGPYELHDFFLYHFLRWGSRPAKILLLAEQAFQPKYDSDTICKWLKLFLTRFFHSQWKRSVMPDGPKVGSVALSPRGDWRMPSDAEVELWLKDL